MIDKAYDNRINLLDAGVVPNNNTVDSYAAIQAVLDTASDGDEVYLPRGFYYVSQALNPKNHGVIINFAGVLCPFGSYTGYLMNVDPTVTTRYTRIVGVYGIRPQIWIQRLTLDGLHQSRGFMTYRAENFTAADITIHRTKGNAFRLRATRECTFHNLQIHQSNGNIDEVTQEPVFWLGEESGDTTNGVNAARFYGLGMVYCGGPNVRIEGRVGPAQQVRMIAFYSPQIHYMERNVNYPWMDIEDNLEFISIRKARNIQFFGGNIRPAGAGPGSRAVRIGDGDYQVTDIDFHNSVFSGEGKGQTGVYVADPAHADRVRLHDVDFRLVGSGSVNIDAPAEVVTNIKHADLAKRIYSRPTHSPLDPDAFLVVDKEGWDEPRKMSLGALLNLVGSQNKKR